jgi:hypothetical protein
VSEKVEKKKKVIIQPTQEGDDEVLSKQQRDEIRLKLAKLRAKTSMKVVKIEKEKPTEPEHKNDNNAVKLKIPVIKNHRNSMQLRSQVNLRTEQPRADDLGDTENRKKLLQNAFYGNCNQTVSESQPVLEISSKPQK